MTFYLKGVLILALTFVLEISAKCPHFNPVKECSCKTLLDHSKEEFSILSCNNIHSETDFKKVVQSTVGYEMFELEVLNSVFRYIPHDAFVGTTFQVLSIRNSSILSLSDTNIAFKGLEKQLHLIEIVNCHYTSHWDWSQLSNLVHMMEIHVSDSDVVDIAEGISRIQHIDVETFVFQKSNVEHLDDRAFAPFSNLLRLVLDNNYISKVRRTMFPKPAYRLKILSLNYNLLEDLPEDIFVDMPSLRSIYLSGNPIHTIEERVFMPIWGQINIFLFYATNLNCDCRITWLAKADNSRKYMHAECYGPTDFKGRFLSDVKPHELWC